MTNQVSLTIDHVPSVNHYQPSIDHQHPSIDHRLTINNNQLAINQTISYELTIYHHELTSMN